MNDKIEEIFKQAGFHSLEVERLCFENRLKKLTRLIIRECASVVDTMNIVGQQPSGKNIKEHFGIKE